jgi:hypothetical protein
VSKERQTKKSEGFTIAPKVSLMLRNLLHKARLLGAGAAILKNFRERERFLYNTIYINVECRINCKKHENIDVRSSN